MLLEEARGGLTSGSDFWEGVSLCQGLALPSRAQGWTVQGCVERRLGGWESGAGLPASVAINLPCDLEVGAPSVGFGLFFLEDWSGWGLSNCSLQSIWHI